MAAGPDEVRGITVPIKIPRSMRSFANGLSGSSDRPVCITLGCSLPESLEDCASNFLSTHGNRAYKSTRSIRGFLHEHGPCDACELIGQSDRNETSRLLRSSFLTHSNSGPGQFIFAERRIAVAPRTRRLRK